MVTAHPAVLRPAERLARSTPAQVEDARRSVLAVLSTARALARLVPAGDGPDDDPVRALARRLAQLPVAAAAAEPVDLATAEAAFRSALTASLGAVRTCRQTLHVSGACWFAASPGDDGCGEVLHLAHALS